MTWECGFWIVATGGFCWLMGVVHGIYAERKRQHKEIPHGK